MKLLIRIVVVTGMLCAMAAAPLQAEQVDNPLYKNWAQFKPGSYAVMEMVTTAAGNKTEVTQTQTLKECTPEKAVIEVKTVMMMAGQKFEQPPTEMEIAAKVPKGESQEGEENPDTEVKEGAEEIEVAGKKIKAKWTETKTKQGDTVTTVKVWTSDEIPGHQVKLMTSTSGPNKVTAESELIEFKADKK